MTAQTHESNVFVIIQTVNLENLPENQQHQYTDVVEVTKTACMKYDTCSYLTADFSTCTKSGPYLCLNVS